MCQIDFVHIFNSNKHEKDIDDKVEDMKEWNCYYIYSAMWIWANVIKSGSIDVHNTLLLNIFGVVPSISMITYYKTGLTFVVADSFENNNPYNQRKLEYFNKSYTSISYTKC